MKKKSFIKIENPRKQYIDSLSASHEYSIHNYFPSKNKLKGEKVTIAILDSGKPTHPDIKNIKDCESFISSDVKDNYGHATMISGIINSNNKQALTGIAPKANVIYGKVLNDKGDGDFNALVSGTLWAICKEADIILMALGSEYDYSVLKDAIKKANDYGICVFSSYKNYKDNEIFTPSYPSSYSNVFSVSNIKINTNIKEIKNNSSFYFQDIHYTTTYKNNKYVRIKGSSFSTSLLAGISACFIEEYKKNNINKKDIPSTLKKTLIRKFKTL